jgi:hypothetical protein
MGVFLFEYRWAATCERLHKPWRIEQNNSAAFMADDEPVGISKGLLLMNPGSVARK